MEKQLKKIVFITGANGFIGQHLVDYLSSRDWEVHTLLRPGSIPSFTILENVCIHYGDLRDIQSLRAACPMGAYVINLAANPYHKTLSFDVNVEGTKNLLEIAKKKGCKMFTHISTQATKISTQGVYGRSKAMSDELVRDSGLPCVILKPSLVYGSGEKGLFVKISKLASKLPFIPVFGDGEVRLYPIHVADLSVLLEKVTTDPKVSGMTFDLGGRQSITYNTLYNSIAARLPNHPVLLHIPVAIGMLMAKIFSVLPNPPIFEDNVLGSTQETSCNPNPLLNRYGYTPRTFKEGFNEVFSPAKVRVGIIGLGKMGMLHATLLRSMPEVEITALIDTNPNLVGTFKSMGIPGEFYPSLTKAISAKVLDAVYITTPTFAHANLLLEATKHKLHVFIEKPIALNGEEIKKLRAQLPKTLVLHAGYTMLYHRPFSKLFEILKTKKYGKILGYEAKFEHGEVLFPRKGWMFTKSLSGGGVLMNPGPHLFSILYSCFGKPQKVSGTLKKVHSLEVEDEASFEFNHGRYTGKVYLSWSVPGKHIADYRLTCRCELAEIVVSPELLVIRSKDGKTKKLRFNDIEPVSLDLLNINPRAFGEAYYLENLMFIEAVLGRGKSNVINDVDSALKIEEVIAMCYSKGNSK